MAKAWNNCLMNRIEKPSLHFPFASQSPTNTRNTWLIVIEESIKLIKTKLKWSSIRTTWSRVLSTRLLFFFFSFQLFDKWTFLNHSYPVRNCLLICPAIGQLKLKQVICQRHGRNLTCPRTLHHSTARFTPASKSNANEIIKICETARNGREQKREGQRTTTLQLTPAWHLRMAKNQAHMSNERRHSSWATTCSNIDLNFPCHVVAVCQFYLSIFRYMLEW